MEDCRFRENVYLFRLAPFPSLIEHRLHLESANPKNKVGCVTLADWHRADTAVMEYHHYLHAVLS